MPRAERQVSAVGRRAGLCSVERVALGELGRDGTEVTLDPGRQSLVCRTL